MGNGSRLFTAGWGQDGKVGSHLGDRTKGEYHTRFPGGTRREGIGEPAGTSIGENFSKSARNMVGITARGMVGNAWLGSALEPPKQIRRHHLLAHLPCLPRLVCAQGIRVCLVSLRTLSADT